MLVKSQRQVFSISMSLAVQQAVVTFKFFTARVLFFTQVEPPTKRGGLTGPQLLEGSCWKRGGDFFQGGLQFSHKK